MTADALTDFFSDAKSAELLPVAQRRVQGLKKAGHDWHASCPACGGKDGNEFVVTPRKGKWLCRKAGVGGSDPVYMLAHIENVSQPRGQEFIRLCEEVLDRDAPEKVKRPATPEERAEAEEQQAAAEERSSETRKVRLIERLEQSDMEAAKLERQQAGIRDLLQRSAHIQRTQAEFYLKARACDLSPDMAFDLRFVPELEYVAIFYDEAAGQEYTGSLGFFPAMLAAIRNYEGLIIGLHRTYLEPGKPRKLDLASRIPGNRKNKTKKVLGTHTGGVIHLGEPQETMCIGEGIETTGGFATECWPRMPDMPDENVSFATAVNLGNMHGPRDHSRAEECEVIDGRPAGWLKGLWPNIDAPAFPLLPEVDNYVFLGDSNRTSPEADTRARSALIVAHRRAVALGKGSRILYAPDRWASLPDLDPKCDFGDVAMGLRAQKTRRAA